MKKKKRPQFFAMYKDFNSGKIESYDVLAVVFDSILTSRGAINKNKFYILDKKWNRVDVRTKEDLETFIDQTFMYHYWSKCEWEFVIIDWPYSTTDKIKDSRPHKVDVYDQLKPNIPVITDLVWDYIEPKIKKLISNE